MKKYFIIAAVTALTLASCAKVESYTVSAGDGELIGFSNYAPRALSRANSSLVNSGALPAGSEIGIYGYSDGTNRLATDPTVKPEFMTNAHVTYSGVNSETATATDPVRYWPKTITNVLSFYGYYPYDNSAITSKPSASTAGLGAFGFTQTSNVTTMVDFMVSDVANDQYYWDGVNANANGVKATNGVVPLTFRHMLSKVNFKFSTDVTFAGDDGIVVTSVSIASGINTVGTLTPSYTQGTAGALGTTDFEWTGQGTPAAVTVPITNQKLTNTPTVNNGTGTAASSTTDFLFVPQDIDDAVVITINYNLTQGGKVTANTVSTKLNVIEFGGSALTKWERNKFYTYSFVIGLKEIKFTGNVIAWTDGGTGTINL